MDALQSSVSRYLVHYQGVSALSKSCAVQIIVKDSNVVCVADAAGCLGALAQGLRKEFASTARSLFSVLLDKLKDKNTNVCMQSGQALAMFHRQGPPFHLHFMVTRL